MATMRARAVLLIVGAAAATVLASCTSDSAPSATPADATFHTQRLVTGPDATVGHSYSLDLLSPAADLHIVAADLHGALYRISTAPSGPVVASATTSPSGVVAVSLTGGSSGDVTIDVAENVVWTLRLSAGVSNATVDLSHGELHGFSALAGISKLDITAARPAGVVPISEAAGLSSLGLHVPSGTAVRVQAVAGAGSVSIFGVVHSGVGAGGTFTAGTSANSYSVIATGGVGSVVVSAAP